MGVCVWGGEGEGGGVLTPICLSCISPSHDHTMFRSSSLTNSFKFFLKGYTSIVLPHRLH